MEYSFKMKVILFMFMFMFMFLSSGCAITSLFSSNDKRLIPKTEFSGMSNVDYLIHLSFLGNLFIETNRQIIIPLGESHSHYLHKLYKKIREKNELLLNLSFTPRFYFINDKAPFYFSLPGGRFFISLGLMKKYSVNESILASIISYEAFRLHKGVYRKVFVIPTGHLEPYKMLSLAKLGVEDKIEVNKWVSHLLRRGGFDDYAYLNWIQIQNKNTLDFFYQHGDIKNILREEFAHKNFLVDNLGEIALNRSKQNSSPEFYNLVSYLKRIEYAK